MFIEKVEQVLTNKGYIYETKKIAHGKSFKLLNKLIVIVYNTGAIVFQGKKEGNEKAIKELITILNI